MHTYFAEAVLRQLATMTCAGDLSRTAPEPAAPGCVRRVSLTFLAAVHCQFGSRLPVDRPAGVTQIAPCFFAYRAPYVFGKSGQRLTGRAAAAFKGAVIRVKRRQHKGVPHR